MHLFRFILLWGALIVGLRASDNIPPDMYANPFVIEGVEIDVSSNSSYTARLQAIPLGQQKAFQVLLNRLQGTPYEKPLRALSEKEVETLVQDIEITQEKVSPVRYTAILVIRFKEEAIQKLLSNEVNAESLLPLAQTRGGVIIPIVQRASQVWLWEEENPLLRHFQEAFKTYEVMDLRLPYADLEDINALPGEAALAFNKAKILHFLERYKIARAIVIAYNQELQTLTIVAVDARGANPLFQQPLPEAELYKKLPTLLSSLLGPQGSPTASEGIFEPLELIIPVPTLEAWHQLQKKLNETPWVKNFTVVSLSPEGAKLKFYIKGGEEGLAVLFPGVTFKGKWPSLKMEGS